MAVLLSLRIDPLIFWIPSLRTVLFLGTTPLFLEAPILRVVLDLVT